MVGLSAERDELRRLAEELCRTSAHVCERDQI